MYVCGRRGAAFRYLFFGKNEKEAKLYRQYRTKRTYQIIVQRFVEILIASYFLAV